MTEAAEPRPLTGGAVLGGISRVAIAGAGALTTILIARLLGPDGSGGYFVAQSVLLLLTVATTLGIEHGIAYYVSSGAWSPRPALSASLRMGAAASVVGVVGALVVRALIPSAFGGLSPVMTLVAAAALPGWLAFFYTSYVALAIDRYEAYVVPPAMQAVGAMMLAGGGAIAFGLEGAIAGMALATALVGVATVLWARRRLPDGDVDPDGALKRAVSFGIKGYLANALQTFGSRADIFVLSAVTSTAAVGHYSVAIAVTTVLWLLPSALAEVLFPRVAHLSAQAGEDAGAHREMVEVKSLRHVVLLVVAATAVLAAALLVLVVPVYGEDFRAAIDLGLILLPGTALMGISNVLASTIIGRGKPVYGLYIVLLTLPLTVVLYAWLIPAEGATGAAVAKSVTYLATFVLMAVFYQRLTGRSVLRSMVPGMAEVRDLAAIPRAGVGFVRGLRR